MPENCGLGSAGVMMVERSTLFIRSTLIFDSEPFARDMLACLLFNDLSRH